MKDAINMIFDKNKRFLWLAYHGFYNKWPDRKYLTRKFEATLGYPLNLDNPQTFNEKIQWLKLYDRKPIYTTMVDKYAVKEYVASIIGEEYIIPTLGVWDRFEDIDFDSLPNQFVLKCTHDSGGLVIVKDKSKLNLRSTQKKISKSLKRNYYYLGREWPYKDVKPRIIAEVYMEDTSTSEEDFKFLCFNGIARCYKGDFNRFIEHKANCFNADGDLLRFGEEICPPDFNRKNSVPSSLGKIEKLASRLSEAQPFLRTDFYDVDGNMYYGELTFYPAFGFGKNLYSGNNELFGNWLKLPEKLGGGYILIYRDLVCVLSESSSIVENGKNMTRDFEADWTGMNSGLTKITPLIDYKIYTINGEAKFCMINQERKIHTRADYFDRDYKWMDFTWGYDHADVIPKKPENYERMFELAEKLSKDTIELRVDFYEVNGHIYFGELTFFDGSGFDKIEPIEWDYKLGSMMNLPSKK